MRREFGGSPDLHRPGKLRVHAPVGRVYMVRSPARDHAGAELLAAQPSRPLEPLLRMHANFRVVHQRRAAQPGIVVQVRRHRHFRGLRSRGIARQTYLHVLHFPYASVSHQLASPVKLLPRTLLRPDLKNPLGRSHRVAHVPALGNRQRSRFLQVHILARAHRVHGQNCVLVVRRRDHHGIHVLIREEFPIVAISSDAVVWFAVLRVLTVHQRLPLLHAIRIQIAHRHNAREIVLPDGRQIVPARNAPDPDRAYVDPVAGSRLPEHACRHNRREPRRDRCAQAGLQHRSPRHPLFVCQELRSFRFSADRYHRIRAFFCAFRTSSVASSACSWSCATCVRFTMSPTNCGPNGNTTSLQSMYVACFLSTRNRWLPPGRPTISAYFRNSMYPSVPSMNRRPSPHTPSPSGVNQSTRTYPMPPLPCSIMSPKSWNFGWCGQFTFAICDAVTSAPVDPV